MRVTPKVRKLVYQRDEYQCVHCGAMTGLSLQHRAAVGMGGSTTAHTPANLVVMCLAANQRLESDAEFAQEGLDMGWKLKRWQDPEAEPVFYAPSGAFFVLNNRGTRIRRDQ